MHQYIYKWLDKPQWDKAVCEHSKLAISLLNGNSIKAVGLDNVKTPDTIIFLNNPIRKTDEELLVSKIDEMILGKDGNIWCKKCFRCLVHEVF